MKKIFFATMLMAAPTALGGALIVTKQGRKKTYDVESLARAEDVTVLEPHEQKALVFRAVPLADVLDKTYGPEWRKEEELLVTCADGYQPSLPVALIREHKAYLAIGVKTGEFAITNRLQNNERVKLGPAYLIWDNQRDAAIRAQGASIWPYQVTGIELVKFATKFAAMAPPEPAAPEVVRGFLAFRHSCENCHRINGQGGEKSIELNYPMNVTEYYQPEFLPKWISDPQSVRQGAMMPPLAAETPNRDQAIRDIVSYLSAMKSKKVPPPEPLR